MAVSTSADRCRFCRLYAVSVIAFASLIGVVTTVQFALAAREKHVSQFLFRDTLHTLAPAASGSALLLALVLWAHPLSLRDLQSDQPRILRRAAAVALPGYMVAALTAAVASAMVLLGVFGQAAAFAPSVVTWRDFGAGGIATVTDTLLILFLAHRYLGRLQAGGMSLPAKLIIVVTVTVGLRASVGLVVSSLAPS